MAGLLEGPDASAADRATAERFHEFAESLRTLLQDARATERAARATQRRQRQAQEDAARANAIKAAQDRAGAELSERRWREPTGKPSPMSRTENDPPTPEEQPS